MLKRLKCWLGWHKIVLLTEGKPYDLNRGIKQKVYCDIRDKLFVSVDWDRDFK